MVCCYGQFPSPKALFAPQLGNSDSGIQKMFACGIRNSTNDQNPESKSTNKESGPRSGIQNPRLSWIPRHGATLTIYRRITPNRVSLGVWDVCVVEGGEVDCARAPLQINARKSKKSPRQTRDYSFQGGRYIGDALVWLFAIIQKSVFLVLNWSIIINS